MRIFSFIAFFTILWSPQIYAQFEPGDVKPIIGDALKDAFYGTTMDGIYKHHREKSGTNRFTETFHTDGTTTYREGPLQDKGVWAIDEDTICFSYTGPLAGGFSCFRVFKNGTCYYSYATSVIQNNTPIDPNFWSVKSVIRGDVSTCDNLSS